jgi:release factor glutamine methyltransferase
MTTIKEILTKYHQKLDSLDLELLIANSIKKPREFVLAHPEYEISKLKIENLIRRGGKISRRKRGEPLAYIFGQKEFFGLDFKVNKAVLVPRPETEMLVEEVLKLQPKNKTIIDVGTGSGNIIISLAKFWTRNVQDRRHFVSFYATDISTKALVAAKQNARLHKVDKKIKFLRGNLLEPFMKHLEKSKLKSIDLIILANLPYLSKKIYDATAVDVRKYEPKEALFSKNDGLAHYEKILKQIKRIQPACRMLHTICYFEISPEQKTKLQKIIRLNLPKAEVSFLRDLAGKWRVCKMEL